MGADLQTRRLVVSATKGALVGAAALAVAQAVRLPQWRGMVLAASGASVLLGRILSQPVVRVAATSES